jgi:hypothetical protein
LGIHGKQQLKIVLEAMAVQSVQTRNSWLDSMTLQLQIQNWLHKLLGGIQSQSLQIQTRVLLGDAMKGINGMQLQIIELVEKVALAVPKLVSIRQRTDGYI